MGHMVSSKRISEMNKKVFPHHQITSFHMKQLIKTDRCPVIRLSCMFKHLLLLVQKLLWRLPEVSRVNGPSDGSDD